MTDDNSQTGWLDWIVDDLRGESAASRRQFLQRSAAAGAGTLALSIAGSNAALAQEAESDETTDVDVLNYALTLEHLEHAFYRDGLERFGENDFERAQTLNGLAYRTRKDVRPNFEAIRDHEKAHVDTLTTVIGDLGGDPVAEACYDFGVEDVDDFIAVAGVLENTGVSAYDGAISMIENADLLTAGATIATVEGRHAAYLNTLNEKDPFPEAFDDAQSMSEILDAAGGFIVDF
ncbi:Tat (twin-arginine translocation) pathway signal sequence [Haloplanus vescus]|uniref:Tat (Twin-arginine translocation) pathway signal sequence n=1 Tax=Haloplanus vescus TaxID=555874 RepID=A0A1H4AJH7_9EURY|nr:ferritin-like domain-containing protein [Haloplanus vescus]SEA36106.1 Tat (twin-arginine translocation) pathway signal sequence [Haloplanus vescus]